MILRTVIIICDLSNKYLYEIIEDYKRCDDSAEQDKIFKEFCSALWHNDNRRKVFKKYIRYRVSANLLRTDLGQIFDAWSQVEYTSYKSRTTNDDWTDLIRQKINNIYTIYCDKNVILKKEYMSLLNTPKKLYYNWVASNDMDNVFTENNITFLIDKSMNNAIQLKDKLQKGKMALTWKDYKIVVEKYLRIIFNSCKLIGEYENKNSINNRIDYITEDHFYISYICKSLEGHFRNYQREYYGVRQHKKLKRCKVCSSLIENTGNKKMYCDKCSHERKLKSQAKYNKKRNNDK